MNVFLAVSLHLLIASISLCVLERRSKATVEITMSFYAHPPRFFTVVFSRIKMKLFLEFYRHARYLVEYYHL